MDGGHYGTYAYVVSPFAAAVLLDAIYPAYAQVCLQVECDNRAS